jgi:hypothetical protein
MRLSMLVGLCLLSTAALAGLVDTSDGWVAEFILVDGSYTRYGHYVSKDACEAALPGLLKQYGGYNGHCIELKDFHFIGSQDPAAP